MSDMHENVSRVDARSQSATNRSVGFLDGSTLFTAML